MLIQLSIGIVNVGALFVIFFYFKRKIDKQLKPSRILKNIRSEIQRLIAEVNQTTDRDIGLLEAKIKELNDYLQKADKRIGLLKQETEKHEMGNRVYNDIMKKHFASKAEQYQEKNKNSSSQESPKDNDKNEKKEEKSMRKQVLELYNQGMSPTIIAKKLDTTIGEVELIISIMESRE